MRSIWNGAISFGLVSIPVKLVNATESHSISFRQIHLADGGRVRYRKVCELDGEEVPADGIGKGYEEADGSVVLITDEDLARLPLATARTIEIMAFVPADEIDPLQLDAAYYLAANGATAAKPYTLLREALKRSRKVAIAKFALRGRERLGMLRVVGDVIAMHGLLWPDEIRAPEGVAPEVAVPVREAELDLADALMATLGEVEIGSLRDGYREALESMIAAKAADGGAGRPAETAAETAGGQVIDLMAALERSVRAAKASRGEAGAGAGAGRTGSGAGAGAVTPIRRKAGARAAGAAGASGAAPKVVGGKKSTVARSGTGTGTGRGTGASTGTGAKAGAGGRKKAAPGGAGKSAAAGSAAAGPAAAPGPDAVKPAAARKTASAAKKAAPRKRASA